jgi:hypothetical protein
VDIREPIQSPLSSREVERYCWSELLCSRRPLERPAGSTVLITVLLLEPQIAIRTALMEIALPSQKGH